MLLLLRENMRVHFWVMEDVAWNSLVFMFERWKKKR